MSGKYGKVCWPVCCDYGRTYSFSAAGKINTRQNSIRNGPTQRRADFRRGKKQKKKRSEKDDAGHATWGEQLGPKRKGKSRRDAVPLLACERSRGFVGGK